MYALQKMCHKCSLALDLVNLRRRIFDSLYRVVQSTDGAVSCAENADGVAVTGAVTVAGGAVAVAVAVVGRHSQRLPRSLRVLQEVSELLLADLDGLVGRRVGHLQHRAEKSQAVCDICAARNDDEQHEQERVSDDCSGMDVSSRSLKFGFGYGSSPCWTRG